MPWIQTVAPEEASGALKQQYEDDVRRAGAIANIVRVQSLNAESLRAGIELYNTMMFALSGLSRAEREMLATVVSQVNNCFY
ncbi:MAG: carboxymuconolactone decarboxylase family protein [Acidobacteria bacterium]|nr:carboxymuconolactone decarboxylase family protein [Acidobacteriota bacterium]